MFSIFLFEAAAAADRDKIWLYIVEINKQDFALSQKKKKGMPAFPLTRAQRVPKHTYVSLPSTFIRHNKQRASD